VRLVAAIVQELSFVELDISLAGTVSETSLKYTGGGKQGVTETPRIFARLFVSALAPVLNSWDYAGSDFHLPELGTTIT